jgi:hypothetical protein
VLLFELSGFSTKRSSAGSSEVDGPELAGGGRESKQAVEYSVENEAAVQPEIDVGKLDNLEEEEKTPEDVASNDEGNVSEEEDFDENDEGILEHAINAGLLNDDDRKKFRESIARIEGTPIVVADSSWNEICIAQDENKTTAQQNNCPTKEKNTGIRRYWLAY